MQVRIIHALSIQIKKLVWLKVVFQAANSGAVERSKPTLSESDGLPPVSWLVRRSVRLWFCLVIEYGGFSRVSPVFPSVERVYPSVQRE